MSILFKHIVRRIKLLKTEKSNDKSVSRIKENLAN